MREVTPFLKSAHICAQLYTFFQIVNGDEPQDGPNLPQHPLCVVSQM